MEEPLERVEVLEIADRCLRDRMDRMRQRLSSGDVRRLSLSTQRVLFEVYSEIRSTGAVGDTEDILRNNNIKAKIESLPVRIWPLMRDVLISAHAQIKERIGK